MGQYFVFVQFAGFIIMAPYVAAGGRYDYVFEEQPQLVSIWWFALFQSVSAFSNTGMSLVDQSMVPFQTAYLMIVGEYRLYRVRAESSPHHPHLGGQHCFCECM
jgi:Trk-type K+ transport system membrane component